MSGPKAVRVVSKKERIARINGLLARLHQALALWQQMLKQCQQTDDVFLADVQQRLAAFDVQLQQGVFNELDRNIPLLTTAILHNTQVKLSQYTTQVAEEKALLRGQQNNARFLLQQLNQKNIAIPDNMSLGLSSIAQGHSLDRLGSDTDAMVLQQAAALLQSVPLAQSDKTKLSEAQQAAQQSLLRLGEQQPAALSLNDWLPKEAEQTAQRQPRLMLLDTLLAKLQVLAPELSHDFQSRLATVEAQIHAAQFNLLLDSLLIDLKTASDAASEKQALLSEIALLVSQWQAQQQVLGLGAEEQDTVQSALSLAALRQQLLLWQTKVQDNESMIAAIASREAVLSGLASLGYEVKEGMQTLWAQDGRIHVRNPATPGYGVEIGGQNSSKVQVRTVRFSPEENRQRDIDVESLWCHDVGQLQQHLAQSGHELIIEKAFAVGQVAVKTAPDALMDAPQIRQQAVVQNLKR